MDTFKGVIFNLLTLFFITSISIFFLLIYSKDKTNNLFLMPLQYYYITEGIISSMIYREFE
jgi:hypothetical protein